MAYIAGELIVGDWTTITLQNGWTAKAGTGTNLPPISYCQTGLTINLRGEVNPPGLLTGNLTIMTLPAVACPPYEYVFNVPILGAVGVGGIRVKPDGTVNLEGITALTSLTFNGIRYSLRV